MRISTSCRRILTVSSPRRRRPACASCKSRVTGRRRCRPIPRMGTSRFSVSIRRGEWRTKHAFASAISRWHRHLRTLLPKAQLRRERLSPRDCNCRPQRHPTSTPASACFLQRRRISHSARRVLGRRQTGHGRMATPSGRVSATARRTFAVCEARYDTRGSSVSIAGRDASGSERAPGMRHAEGGQPGVHRRSTLKVFSAT